MATMVKEAETLVGQRIRRREDPRLITGTAVYVDDIQMPGMHHACILRSPHAAANIKAIRTEAAAKLPGVVAVFTGADVKDVGPVPCGASLPGLRVPQHPYWPTIASTMPATRLRWRSPRTATWRATRWTSSRWITSRWPQ